MKVRILFSKDCEIHTPRIVKPKPNIKYIFAWNKAAPIGRLICMKESE